MADENQYEVPDDLLDGGLEAAFGPDDPEEAPPGFLRCLGVGAGDAPLLKLRDDQPHLAGPPASGASASPTDRYVLAGEIARGGVGAVFRARDVKLGRDTAMKILLARHRGNPALTRRFIEEAQIAGQLQHPGVAPVHDLGVLEDDTPYFTMKLVQGETLSALLGRRGHPGEDRRRFVGIFEKICQTLAYAHARGVIHRDLKPSNIMVGSFGEVQVMDWGLAKVLPGSRGDDAEAIDASIATIRTAAPGLESQVGSVLGTPAYMSPEQALGHVDDLDERSDVFGLGAILCEVLTGKPPYTGESARAVHREAKAGNIGEAVGRLGASGADAELVDLTTRCLSIDPGRRPHHAGVVADELSAHLLSVEERAREAEVAAVAATVKARGERKARRLTVALAAAVVMAILIGGGFYLVQRRREASVVREVERAIAEVEVLQAEARGAKEGDLAAWDRALTTAEHAATLASPTHGVDESLTGEARALFESIDVEARAARAAALRAEKNRGMVARLEAIRGEHADDLLWYRHEPAYAEAFRDYGLDVDSLDPRVAASRMRESGIAVELATALDDWARARRRARGEDAEAWWKLVDLALSVDPDPWRTRLRGAARARDLDELRALAGSPELTDASPLTVRLLAANLVALGDRSLGESVYRSGLEAHPGDFWIHLELALLLGGSDSEAPRHQDALRFMTAALALRPHSPYALNGMGVVLSRMKQRDEAIAYYERAISIKPDHALASYNLGRDRWERGEVIEAIAAYEKALRIYPDFVEAHYNLGQILYRQGELDRALESFQETIRLRPGFVEAHHAIGNALWRTGDVDGAVAAYRETVRLRPGFASAWYNLGKGLFLRNDLDGAIRALRQATRLEPAFAEAFAELGVALRKSGDLEGAVSSYRAALRLQPELAEVHYNLGEALYETGDVDGALPAYREASRLDPEMAEAHYKLGLLLRQKGEFADALAALRRSHALGSLRPSWSHPSARWVRDCERMVELATKLEAVRRGEIEPRDAAERVALATVCYYKGLYPAAARFYREAFESDPRLVADPANENRYNAACMAALAARGLSKDGVDLGDAGRAAWRRQAVEWLRQDLLAWAKSLEHGRPEARARLRMSLAHWLSDGDLADLRDEPALRRLTDREREDCEALWGEVRALLRRAEE